MYAAPVPWTSQDVHLVLGATSPLRQRLPVEPCPGSPDLGYPEFLMRFPPFTDGGQIVSAAD